MAVNDDRVWRSSREANDLADRIVERGSFGKAYRPSCAPGVEPRPMRVSNHDARSARRAGARRRPTLAVAGLVLPVPDVGVLAERRRKLAASGAKVRGL